MLHELLHFFGRAICHQLEERSLTISGETLAVCARDTGIYIGIFSTLSYLYLFKRKRNITIPSIKISFLLLLLLVPLMIDGLGSYTHLFETNNVRRFVTGVLFGLVLPYFLYPLLSKKSLEQQSEPVICTKKDLFFPIFICILFSGLFYFGQPSHLVLDSFLIITIIFWFSLCASFLFTFIKSIRLKASLSLASGISFLTILSLLHGWVLSLSI